jgi:4a-hydroxytetrahydrobiopterin dehydratase
MQFDTMNILKRHHSVNFRHTIAFVNKIAALAEKEGHQPDLHVSYGYCIVDLWTHAIKGLSKNDFILAAEIDELK